MTEDLTDEIDRGLAQMEALIRKMRKKVAEPASDRIYRNALKSSVVHLEDPRDLEPEEAAEEKKPILKVLAPKAARTAPLAKTTLFRRLAGN